MRRFVIRLVLLFLGFLVLAGCDSASGRFPQFLVGTWQADASQWQITLASDGTVVSAVSNSGLLLPVAEGRLYQQSVKANEFGYFEFGPSYATYDSTERRLAVLIDIESVVIEAPSGGMEGNARYNFSGEVSEDGGMWFATWWTDATFGGMTYSDPNEIVYESLVFKKLKAQ